MSENNYLNYQNMLTQVNQGVAQLTDVCDSLQMKEHSDKLRQSGEHLKNRMFSVGIMGEFRRGKSTVINALLGREIVPSDIVPTSATLNYIRWGMEPAAQVNYKDGTSEAVAVEDLPKYITKIEEEYERVAETVDNAVVYYPCPFCKNGVEIVDTPGLNDDERMTKISEEVIPKLDAIIMVLVPDSPFSISEAEFVRNKVMSSDLGRIIFVLNKIDQVRPKDRQKLIESIKGKIRSAVLDKQAAMYGEESEEYKQAQEKLAGIRLVPISARSALEGRLENDYELVQESGIEEFEAVLAHLLTEERGLLELIGPMNTVLSIVNEARGTIDMRRSVLEMKADEFESVRTESMKKLSEQREIKRREVEALKGRAVNLYGELLPEVEKSYQEIGEMLSAYVNGVSLTPEDVKNEKMVKKTMDRVNAGMTKKLEAKYSEITEKLNTAIQRRLGDDLVSANENLARIGKELEGIYSQITSKSKNEDGLQRVLPVGLDVAANFLFSSWIVGVGGVIEGYKVNKVKGALVGGVAGAAGGFAGLMGMGALMVATGVILPTLPVALVVGLAGSVSGRLATKLVFGKKIQEKKIEEVRTNLREGVQAVLTDIRKERPLEMWLKDTSAKMYQQVAAMLDSEIEATISGLENNITQMKLDLQKNKQQCAAILEDMNELDKKLTDVYTEIEPVRNRLSEALETKKE